MTSMPIANYTVQYDIYDTGLVRSKVNNNILVPRVNSNGYQIVTLGKKQLSVHRLVAQHFIANPYNLSQVNHKDGNKLNNDYRNLEWCTAERNTQHALETGLRTGFIPYSTKVKLMHRAIEGELIADIALEFPNTHQNTLSRMLRITAQKENMETEWKSAMKTRRRNAAIRNISKYNDNRQ